MNRQHSSSDEDELGTSIDAKLKQSAKRNNLTPQNVKNILQVSEKKLTIAFDIFNSMSNSEYLK